MKNLYEPIRQLALKWGHTSKVYRTDDICEETVPDLEFQVDVFTLLKEAQLSDQKLQLLMDDIKCWSDSVFGESGGPVPKLYHLIKEVTEAIVVCKRNANSFEALFEFADCFMLLLDAASHSGIDAKLLHEVTRRKLEINKRRKWGNPDANGVVEHIEEPSDPEVGHEEYLRASGQVKSFDIR